MSKNIDISKKEHKLNLHDVIVTTLTSVIGGGIFIMSITTQKEAFVGSSMFISYIIGAILAIILALSYSQLSSIFPKTGGDYIYVSRLLNPYVGFIVSWLRWMGNIAGISFLTFHTIKLINEFLGLNKNVIYHEFRYTGGINFFIIEAMFVVVALLYMNLKGLRMYKYFQNILNYVMISGIIIFIVYSIYNFNISVFKNSLILDWKVILLSSSIIFWAYTGFQTITYISEEVEEPEKNIPKGMLISLGIISLIYISMSILVYGLINAQDALNYDSIPSILREYNIYVYYGVAISAIMALLGGISPAILASSRLLYAWSRDKLIPKVFMKTDEKGNPYISLIVVVLITLIMMYYGQSGMLVAFSSVVLIMSYFLTSLSSFIMRFNHRDLYEHAGFKFNGIWIVSLIGSIISGLFIYSLLFSSKSIYWFSLVWITSGTILYLWRYEKHKLYDLVEKELELLKRKVVLKRLFFKRIEKI